MLYKMITNARNKWFESKECTVKEIIQYMVDKDERLSNRCNKNLFVFKNQVQ